MDINTEHLEYISLKNGKQAMFLKCFQETSLREKAYFKIQTIDEMLRFNIMNKKLNGYYWKQSETNKGQQFEMKDLDGRLNLKQLINDCEEIREYVRVVAPQYIVWKAKNAN